MLNLNGEPVREMIGTKSDIPDQPEKDSDALLFRISENVRALRKARNLRQEDLAGLIDLSLATVKALEQGQVAWNARHIARVSRALDVDPAVLLGPATIRTDPVHVAVERGDPVAALRALAEALEAAPGPELDPTARRLLSAYQAKDWPALMRLCADLAERWGIDR